MMKNINLTQKEYDYIIKHKQIDSGTEAIICKIHDEQDVILKLFDKTCDMESATYSQYYKKLENKKNKVVELHNMKDFDNEIKTIKTYTLNHEFIGYTMTFDPDNVDLLFACITEKEDLITYLKQYRQQLKKYHELGIVYGDNHSSNLLLNPQKGITSFCDLDNMKVKNYPIDKYSNPMSEFIYRYGSADEKMDSYMFNLLTVNRLENLESWYQDPKNNCDVYAETFDYLSNGNIPEVLEEKKVKSIIKQMNDVTKNYEGQYLIDHVRKDRLSA